MFKESYVFVYPLWSYLMKKIKNKVTVLSAVSLSAFLLGAANTNVNKTYAKTASVKTKHFLKSDSIAKSKNVGKLKAKSTKIISSKDFAASVEKQNVSNAKDQDMKLDSDISEATETGKNDVNSHTNALVNKQEDPNNKGQETETNNEDKLVKDALSYADVSVSASPNSTAGTPLGWNNMGYMVSVSVKNSSNTGEVIPKGSKITIRVAPDNRVSYKDFLVYSSINQENHIFSVVDNSNGTYDFIINEDLVPGTYNFIANFATRKASYDWNKPKGSNTVDPDPVPGEITISSNFLGSSNQIFTDTVYVKPAGYTVPGPGVGAPGYGTAGYNGQPEFNIDPEYYNESAPVYLPDGTTLRSANDKSASGSMFFSYIINYQAAIGSQAGAKLSVKSKDKIDLQHYHLLIDKRVTGGQIEDITNDPLLKWTITDNEVTVDAGKYMTTKNLGYPLYLRVYVPEHSIEAINEATLQTGPSIFYNKSTFQNIDLNSNIPYFRGGNATVYDTATFDAKTGLMAFEGTNSLTNKIKVTNFNGYPENGKNLKVGSYNIEYAVTGSDNKTTTYSRIITVKHSQAEIKTKDTTIVAGPNSTWQSSDNFISAKSEDGQTVNFDSLKVTGTVNTKAPGDYRITYAYSDKNGNVISTAIAIVHVVESKADIKAHDTEIYLEDTWNPETAFDKCTDAQGNSVSFSEVKVSGDVSSNKEGKYPVKYSYTDSAGNIKEANVIVTVSRKQNPSPKDPDRVSTVIVQYQDAQGNKIAADEILSGKIGDIYHTFSKEISGYTFKEVDGNPDGVFSYNLVYIRYIYTKDTNENSNLEEGSNPGSNNHKNSAINNHHKIHRNNKSLEKGNIEKRQAVDPIVYKEKDDLKSKELPRTGRNSKQTTSIFLLGITLLVASISSIFGIIKKKNDE